MLVVSAVFVGAPRAIATDDLRVTVSHEARSIQPGEVVRLTVAFSRPVESVRGRAFDRPVVLYPTADPAVWRGLVGIDLDVEVRDHVVAVAGTAADGRSGQARHTLTIRPKEFTTRRLTVAPEYVSPPSHVLERIQRESQRTTEIFRTQTPERQWRGAFRAPVPGQATSSFGRRSVFNGQPRSPHSGTDFRAGEGTPVAAPNAGTVALSADLYFSGNCVILDHGLGLYSFFAHLSRSTVSEGDVVAPGDTLGRVGATGRVTGPHLHWTVRLNTARVDPLSLMEILSDPTSES